MTSNLVTKYKRKVILNFKGHNNQQVWHILSPVKGEVLIRRIYPKIGVIRQHDWFSARQINKLQSVWRTSFLDDKLFLVYLTIKVILGNFYITEDI